MDEKKLILFFDCGDTLVDESTQIWEKNEKGEETIVLEAELIPGAKDTILELKRRGYRMAIVADGQAASFLNLLGQHEIIDCFEALIYSEQIKVCKPDRRMFKAAIGAMDLEYSDADRIAMVGNNLSRDVKGANLMGITSVFQSWTPRYPKDHADDSEKPDYIVTCPEELIDLVEELNKKVIQGKSLKLK